MTDRAHGPAEIRTALVVAPTADRRDRLARLLATARRLKIVAGQLGRSLAAQIDGVEPDVLVIDLGPTPDTGEVAAALARTRPAAIVALADDPRGALAAFDGAGRALLPRCATACELEAAVEAALAGLVALHPNTVSATRTPPRAAERDDRVAPESLTPREIEVLGLMAEGLGNKSIAARLGLSGHTVKFHVAAILAKLGAESRTEAVTLGLRRGLIMI
jgi:DNA-binding NarL/FixJ family response regulator